MDEPATSSPSAAVGAGPAEQDNLPDPPTLDGFGPMSLSPGCAAWGVLYWHHDDSVPNGGLVHLYDVELYRSSDDVMVYEGVHDFTLSFLPIRSPVTDDCDSALPGDQDVPIVVPGASYYAKVSAWNGVGWSSPAVSESREAVTLPGLDDEATWGDCVCETSTGRLFPLNILRGDPVNTATGTLTESVTDATIPGVGPAVSATRTYNSTDTSVGPLGKGWSFPYFAGLTAGSSAVTYVAEDGQEVVYEQDGTDFETPPGVSSRLHPTSSGYELRTKDHQVIEFDQNGRLTGAQNPSGQGVSLSYAGDGTVDKVSDTSGHELDITMNAAGLLTSIGLPDGRSVEYGYTDGLLTSVTDMRGGITQYEYDAADRLVAITDPLGNEVMRTTYDGQGRVAEQTDANGGVTSFEYAADGEYHTTYTTDPRGGVSRDLYYGNVLLESETPGGAVTTYAYDERLRLMTETDPHGRVTRHRYDENDNLTATTYPNGDFEQFTYSPDGELLTETSPEGRTTTYTYDAQHRVETTEDAAGGVTSYTYTAKGQQETVTTPEGRTTTYEYDSQGNRTATISPEGHRTSSVYDAYGRRVSQTSARGNEAGADPADYTTTFGYDAGDNLVSTTDPLGNETTYTYDLAGQQTSITDPLGRETVTSYDAAGNVVSVTDPAGGTTVHDYNDAGDRIATTDPEGGATTWTYDADGRQVTRTTPRGNEPGADPADYTWSYTYDGLGNMLTETDPAGGTVSYGYDERYRQITVTDQAGETTATEYDGDGNAIRMTDPLGRVTRTGFNDLNLPTSIRDSANFVGSMGYDADGLLLSETTPLGNTTSYTYDDDGNQITRTTPRGNEDGANASQYTWSYGYDADGNQATVTDPLGGTTRTEYDPRGLVTSVTDPVDAITTRAYDAAGQLVQVEAPDGGITSYEYSQAGDLSSTTDANGNTSTLDHDLNGRVIASTDPLGRTTTFGYDAEGNHTSTVLARGAATGDEARWTIVTEYDPLGRRSVVSTGDGATHTYAYDGTGRMTGFTDTDGTTTLAYDDAGQLTSVERDGTGYTYSYDSRGLINAVTYPDGGSATFTHDGDRRTTSMTGLAGATVDYTYDADSNLVTTDHPARAGGTGGHNQQERNYDAAGRLSTSTFRYTGMSGHDRIRYERDAAGRPTQIEHESGSLPTSPYETFTYDDAGRLSAVCYQTASAPDPCTETSPQRIAYTYDDIGNRLTEERVGVDDPGTHTATYDAAGQIATRDGVTVTHDADGNLTSDGQRSFTYDEFNQLVAVDDGTGAPATFTYDALGQRATATVDGEVRDYHWDSSSGLPKLTSIESGTAATSYRYAPTGEPVWGEIDGTTTAFDTDALGSITAVYPRFGGIPMWASDYEPFGTPRNTDEDSLTTEQVGLGYTGEYLDPATGLLNLRLRDYDPALGRFTSTDPAPTPPGTPSASPYAYVDNQPTTRTDPSGACWRWSWCIELIGRGHSAYGDDGAPSREEIQGGIGLGIGKAIEEGIHGTITGFHPFYSDNVYGWQGDLFADQTGNMNPWTQWSADVGELGFWAGLTAASPLLGTTRGLPATAARAQPCPPGITARVPWTSWQQYPKITRNGREYALIGNRLYTRHAVNRMQPSGLGSPAGEGGAGRSISPNFVEDVLRSTHGVPVKGPLGESRLSFVSGRVQVITENDIVVTVITR